MAMFYDWRNREGKGVRPLREQLRELRSPMFIALGILLLVVVAFSVRAYITGRHSSVESEKVYLLPDPPERKRALPEVLSDVVQSVERGDGFDLDSATDMRSETPDDTDSVAVAEGVKTDDSPVAPQVQDAASEPTMAELDAADSETEFLLTEGDVISEQAAETMNQGFSMIIAHLNNLSPDEQQAFVDQVRDRMSRHIPPELQEFYARNPNLKNQGYELFLSQLREKGFEHLR